MMPRSTVLQRQLPTAQSLRDGIRRYCRRSTSYEECSYEDILTLLIGTLVCARRGGYYALVTKIFIGLGSNIGNRQENLKQALATLLPEIAVRKISPVYETAPMYVENQPKFLNAVCEATTELSAVEVFKKLKQIEEGMARAGTFRFGPRIIDLDMLFYGDARMDTPELTVPHPRIAERAFVLAPMIGIAPDFVHPVLGCTMAQLLSQLGDYSHLAWKTNIAL